MIEEADVVVIGGGQAGLAAGYFLRRAGLDFVVLDAQDRPGGAWQHMWESLRLFSPADHNPLPGWWMPRQDGEPFPTADHVADYLRAYEQRYTLPVHRPVRVRGVHDVGAGLTVETDHGTWHTSIVVSATGIWQAPHRPRYPGGDEFTGEQLHTVSYDSAERFRGQRVVVVGGGNSAAQILADVSTVAETTWVTRRPPRFMPDDVDGRALFDVATRHRAARRTGTETREDTETRASAKTAGVSALGDIVMVPSVLRARDRGVLHARPLFDRLTPDGVAWADGTEHPCDVIIWCTGFHPVLAHLAPLDLECPDGVPKTVGTRSVEEPRLYLLGYGDWTGYASATLIGAGRTAKPTVAEIAERLRAP